MRRFGILFLFPAAALLLAACSSLPPIRPGEGLSLERTRQECRLPFLREETRLIHSLQAVLPDGSGTSAIGITVADPAAKTLRLTLMTLEGFVLFTARIEGENLEIERAVAPFTNKDFARSLIGDVMFCLFPPGALPETVGLEEGNRPACRYRSDEDTATDVVLAGPAQWEVRLYREGSLTRTLRAAGLNEYDIPKKLELTGHGPFPYRLTLTLLTGTPLRLESRPESLTEEEEDAP
ncbi:MAG: hypothetical protein CVU61_08790 [Deltaproteobacteria bacterium HGW-Deltaproteobacteria-19]|jgi:hypothetical protein|nr:MAG: hypothetical protein CVU61_08790 [Deltaproteobacteria bacterium HGW-Deltaproteobacteria-19]